MSAKEFYEAHQQEEFLSKGEIIKMMQQYVDHLEEEKKAAQENISQAGEQC